MARGVTPKRSGPGSEDPGPHSLPWEPRYFNTVIFRVSVTSGLSIRTK